MRVAVYLPMLLGVLVWWLAPRLADRGRPALVARVIAGTAVVAALCSTWALGLLALTALDDLPPLRVLDDDPLRELPEPVPGPVALLAALLLAGAAVRLTVELARRLGTVRRMRAVGVVHEGVVVADLDTPMAVAVPGRPGHVLVTTAMLRLLDRRERAAMYAHERAHLRHRHHLLVTAAAAAAAVNPLLGPARDAVAYLIERWADEDAAAEVGDRDLVARAVARAALATVGPGPLPGIDGGVVVRRVRALSGSAPTRSTRRLVAFPVLLGVFAGVTVFATAEFVELARAWL